MTRVKVNDYCEFPMDINMEPFTQEGMARNDLKKEKEAALAEGLAFDKEIPELEFPPEYYEYQLKGVVIHTGTAESGHYYTFIQDRETGQWYEFNDTLVREFDPAELPAEAFGGEERWTYLNASTAAQPTPVPTSTMREKFKNAYLLFYERKSSYQPRTKDDNELAKIQLDQWWIGEPVQF